MKIVSIKHKGVERLYQHNDASKLDSRIVAKVAKQLLFIENMDHSEELRTLTHWRAHQLSDKRWSLHVTANFRLTFFANNAAGEISGLDLEDYH